jgi:hypothetical protein
MDPMTAMYDAAMALVERKVCTAHIYPPIPCRDYDWTAWFDDVGQEGPAGYGRTESEAKQDLLDNYADE